MAVERENAPIDLEIEPNSAQEIDASLLMEGDAMNLGTTDQQSLILLKTPRTKAHSTQA